MWIPRLLEQHLEEAANSRPVVLLTGARQTGKSSLLQHTFPDLTYITLDSIQQAELAIENPDYFLDSLDPPVILDEIQYAPDLLRHLKVHVDRNRDQYGRWLLAGSQKFELMTSVSDSLAGRISILHLETLSALELRDSGVQGIAEFVWKGGYPEIWANPNLNATAFFESYIRTYLERDLKAIVNVSNLLDFQRFVRIAATRVGQPLNYRDMARDIGVSDVTVRKWLGALEQSGIVYLLPPYFANIGKRLVKAPKLFFSDHGLLAFLLNINSLSEWQQHTLRGPLWENIVFTELLKTQRIRPGAQLFFYRDQNAVEVDFVVEAANEVQLIEARASEKSSSQKYNFSKVAPLFKEQKVSCLVAANIPDTRVYRRAGFTLFNPLYASLPVS